MPRFWFLNTISPPKGNVDSTKAEERKVDLEHLTVSEKQGATHRKLGTCLQDPGAILQRFSFTELGIIRALKKIIIMQ